MKALVFTITTRQPVLANALEGDPNSGETYPYIPGSLIRGAIIARFQQQLDLKDPETHTLFFSNNVRFLHAYPVQDGQRAVPLPVNIKPAQTTQKQAQQQKREKHDPSEWLIPNQKFATTRHLNIHTTRNRAKGRSTRDAGAVYRYVSIAPHQDFQAVIVGDEPMLNHLKTIIDRLIAQQPTLWMGGARSAGYGEVHWHDVNWCDTWREIEATIPTTKTTMTLLSDAILRDSDGQYARSLTGDVVGLNGATLNLTASNIKYTVIGGFNRKWGLPLPQTPALAAGSVLVWNNAMQKDIENIEAEGIGERRNEGYGRVTFADLQTDRATAESTERQSNTIPMPTIPHFASEGSAILTTMSQRLIRQAFEQALVRLIRYYQIKDDRSARNSQLGRVERWARRLLDQPTAQQLAELHTHLQTLAQPTRQFLRRARLDNGDSLYSLLSLNHDAIRRLWHDIQPIKLGDQSFDRDHLAIEYYARLIIAIVTLARKQSAGKRGSHG